MKKLISLVTVVAIVAASSLCAFASTDITSLVADAQPIAANETTGLYDVVAPSTGDYSTILAVKGKTIQVGAIQYINQAAAENGSATFNFALNDDLLTNETSAPITDDVYVLTGGDGDIRVAGYIDVTEDVPPQTGFTVSGTVSNVVTQDFIDEELVPYIEELAEGDEEFIANYTELYTIQYATTARLYNKAEWKDSIGEEYLAYYEEGGDAPEAIDVQTVDNITGEYSFANIVNGEYVVLLERLGALPYFQYVTVDGGNVDVGAKELALGDAVADYAVDFGDVSYLIDNMADLCTDEFTTANDANIDMAVDFGDVSSVIASMTDIWSYEEEEGAIAELIQ